MEEDARGGASRRTMRAAAGRGGHAVRAVLQGGAWRRTRGWRSGPSGAKLWSHEGATRKASRGASRCGGAVGGHPVLLAFTGQIYGIRTKQHSGLHPTANTIRDEGPCAVVV